MILMSKYKGLHGGKTGSKNSGAGVSRSPLFSDNARKKTFFFYSRASLSKGGFPNSIHVLDYKIKLDIQLRKCDPKTKEESDLERRKLNLSLGKPSSKKIIFLMKNFH